MLTLRLARPSPRRRQRGFTLIELLVGIAIMGVAMSLAAPELSQMLAARKVRVAAMSVLDGLNIARAEAVRRNTEVKFVLAGDGWSVQLAADSTVLRGSNNTLADNTLTLASSSTATEVTFTATGLRKTGTQMERVSVASTVGGAGQRRIDIYGGGLIRMCDPLVTADNDPRRC